MENTREEKTENEAGHKVIFKCEGKVSKVHQVYALYIAAGFVFFSLLVEASRRGIGCMECGFALIRLSKIGVLVFIISFFILKDYLKRTGYLARRKLGNELGGKFPENLMAHPAETLRNEFEGLQLNDFKVFWKNKYQDREISLENYSVKYKIPNPRKEGLELTRSLDFAVFRLEHSFYEKFDIHFTPYDILDDLVGEKILPEQIKNAINSSELSREKFIPFTSKTEILDFLEAYPEFYEKLMYLFSKITGPAEVKVRDGFISLHTIFVDLKAGCFEPQDFIKVYDFLIDFAQKYDEFFDREETGSDETNS
ncbi:MAG: hypothetical protein ACLFQV_14030 [Vulcanimicrobiota bacterium]